MKNADVDVISQAWVPVITVHVNYMLFISRGKKMTKPRE